MAKEKDEQEKGEGEPEKPARNKADNSLTRAGMEAVIKQGGAVVHKGVHYSRVEDLPDEADLIAGDSEAAELALQALDQEEAQLKARRARLERSRAPAGDDEAQARADEEAARKKAEAKRRAAADARAKAEAEADARAKAEAEAKAKAQAGGNPPTQ